MPIAERPTTVFCDANDRITLRRETAQSSGGYARITNVFDAQGRFVEMQYRYETNQLVNDSWGYSRMREVYGADGKHVETQYLTVEGDRLPNARPPY